MEITQIMDITVAEAEYRIKADVDFNSYQYISYKEPTEDFPFRIIDLSEGSDWNSKITRLFIRDNAQGGVFVITVQTFTEGINWAVRYGHYINTLEIIEK